MQPSDSIDVKGFLYDPCISDLGDLDNPFIFESQTHYGSKAQYDFVTSRAPWSYSTLGLWTSQHSQQIDLHACDENLHSFPTAGQKVHKPALHARDRRLDSFYTVGEDVRTLMIKHIPCRCTREEVLDAIDSLGFEGTYEFFHLPTKRGQHNFGYAFISFWGQQTAIAFQSAMNGFIFRSRQSSKSVCVVPARIQGFAGTNGQHARRARRNMEAQKQLTDLATMELYLDTVHATW